MISGYDQVEKNLLDIEEITELLVLEQDDTLLAEISDNLVKIEEKLEDIRLKSLLKGKYDGLNALLTLHAGAGL